MADYKISLGAEVRTSEIDKQVKDYKGKVNVGVNPDSITSGIDAAIKGYRATPIKVGSTLNTQGITEKLKSFSKKENRKNIKVGIDQDHLFDGVETIIGNKTFKTPLKVNVDLNWAGVANQIANPNFGTAGAPKFKLDVELDDDAFLQALEKYKNNPKAKEVPFRVKPVMSPDAMNDVEATLGTYEAKTPLKVKLKISKTEINNDVAEYNQKLAQDSGKRIIFNAALRANAIDDAINNYTSKHPDKLKIPIDFKINNDLGNNSEFETSLKQRIEQYENTPIQLPVVLKPASKGFKDQISKVYATVEATLTNPKAISEELNSHIQSPLPVSVKLVPATKGFTSEITKTPVQVHAELAPNAINDAITNAPKNLSKLPVGVTLTTKDANDINKQVQQLKPFVTEKLDVGVKLDESKINADIGLFQPTATLGVKPDLILEDVDDQIRAYVPKAPIKVNVKVNDGEADKRAGTEKIQDVIQVNVKLDRENINEQIRKFKTDTKIKVGVKLDFASHKNENGDYIQKGIAKQIKEYEAKSKVKIGAQLDKDAVDKAIQDFKTDVPIKLGVELDTKTAENQIEELKAEFKKFGNITINFNNSNDGSGNVDVAEVAGSGGSISNTTRQIREMDIAIENSEDQVTNLQNALGKIGFDKSSISAITKEFEKLEISVRNVTSRLREDGSTTLTIKGVDQNGRIVKAMRSVDEKGNVTNLGTTISQDFKETENAFKRLKSLGKEISQLDIKIAGLDTNKNAGEIEELIAQLNRLEAEYNDLFDITEKNLSSNQINELAQDIANSSSKVDAVKARVVDKANAKEISDAYNQIYNTRKRIGDLEVDLIGAEAKDDLKAVKDINDEIARLKNNLATLEQNNIGAKFTDEQKSGLKELRKQSQYNKRQAQNSVDYKAGVQAEKDEAKSVNDTYNQIYNIKKKIGSLEVDLISAEDTKDAQILRAEIERLKNELLELEKNDFSSKFSENQKKSLEELENQINFNKKQAENKVDVKLESQIRKEETAKISEVFEKVRKTKEEIGKLEVELIGEKAKGDIKTFDTIIERLTECKNKLLELNALTSSDGETYSSKFSDEQKGKLDEIDSEYAYKKKHASSQIVDKTAIKETENAFKRLKELGKEIGQLDIKIANLDPKKDIAEIDKLTDRLNKLEAEYNDLFDSTETNLTGNQIDELLRDIESGGDKLDVLKAKLNDVKAALAKKIELKLNDSTVEKQVKNVTAGFNSIKNKSSELQTAMNNFNNTLSNLNDANDYEGADRVERLIAAYQEYERALKAVNNQLDINKRAEKDAAADEKLVDDRRAFQAKIDAWLTRNSAAVKDFGADLLDLKAQAESCDRVKLDHLEREFKRIDTEVEAAGKKMQTFPDRIKAQFQKYSSYFSIASVFMYAEQAIRSMFEQVKLIDSAMTELKKVTNETDASYNRFLKNAASRSKELGTTVDGLVSSTADFARLGYGFKDSQKLAEVANIYAVVGDEIDGVEGATQSLVSTMAAFKDEMNGMSDSDFAMSIVDKMNEVSNNFAISSGGIGEALQRSASSMAAANNSLDETIALITAANEVTQNPEKVGNAMKTISMRIRGAKTELEDMGESTDGMVDSTATLRAEIKALSGVDIMASATEFKSTYQILDELSQKWEDLTDIQQASIIELMAGKHQGNVFSSIMTNFQTARDALDTSLGSSGSAMAEHAKWSESLEASLNKLKAAWQSLAQTFMDSSFLKVGMEAIISLVSVLDKLLDTLGSLGTIGLGTSIFSLFKTKGTGFKTGIFGALSDFGSTVSSIMSSGDGLIKKFKGIGKAAGDAGGSITKSFGGSLSAAVTGIGLAVTAISLLYNQHKKAKEAAAEARREAIEDSNKYLDAAFSFEEAYIKYSGKTNLTVEEEAELTSAINSTVDALGDKSSALRQVVNSSNDYVSSLERIKNAELEDAKIIAQDKQKNAKLDLEDMVSDWSGESVSGSPLGIDISYYNSTAKKIAKDVASDYYKEGEKKKGRKKPAVPATLSIDSDASADEILDYYYALVEFKNELLNVENFEDVSGTFEQVDNVIEKMSETVKVYEDGLYDFTKADYQLKKGIPKTIEEYIAMREAILKDEDIKKLPLDARTSILNSLDSEYSQIFDLSSAEVQARKFVGIIKAYGNGKVDGTNEIGTVETFLNMRTAVNNNECTVGEYLSQFNKVNNLTNGKDGAGKSWSEDEKRIFKTTLGLDTDTIKQQYADMQNYLLREAGVNSTSPHYDATKNRITEFLNGLTAEELKAVIDVRTKIDWKYSNPEDILKQIEDQAELNRAMSFNISIDVETSGIDSLNTALAESKSAIGLTAESINALKDRYKDLDGYNAAALFEETANGIRVNSTELAKLEKEYKDFNKQEIDKTLKTLEEEYYKLTDEINNCTDDQAKLNSLYRERDAVLSQINNVASLASQYEGLTSAYNEWMKAQEAGQDRDIYESIISGREEIEEEMSLGWLDDAAVEYLELLTSKELSTAGIDAQIAAYKDLDKTIEGTKYSLWDFLTVNEEGKATSDGVYNFFDAVRSATDETAAWVDENGKYHFNFEGFEYNGKTGDAAIAEYFKTSEEFVQIMAKTAEDAGFVVHIEGEYTDLANASDDIHDLNEQLKSIGATSYTFNVNTSDLSYANEQIAEAESALQYFENRDGKINLDDSDVRAAATILTMLVFRKSELENPTLMSLDVSEPTTKLEEVLSLAQQLKNAKANLEIQTAIGADTTEAQTEIDSLLTQLSSDKYADITAGLKIDTTSVDSAIASINAVSGEQMIELGLDTSKIDGYKEAEHTTDGVVNWDNNDEKVKTWIMQPHEASGTVYWDDNTDNLQTIYTGKGIIYWDTSEANGTANANGTAFANGSTGGRAFKQGNWGTKDSGTALGGELGRKIFCDHT